MEWNSINRYLGKERRLKAVGEVKRLMTDFCIGIEEKTYERLF